MRNRIDAPTWVKVTTGLALGLVALPACGSGSETQASTGKSQPKAASSVDTGYPRRVVYSTSDFTVSQISDYDLRVSPNPSNNAWADKDLALGIDTVLGSCPGAKITGSLIGYENGTRTTVVYMSSPKVVSNNCVFPSTT